MKKIEQKHKKHIDLNILKNRIEGLNEIENIDGNF